MGNRKSRAHRSHPRLGVKRNSDERRHRQGCSTAMGVHMRLTTLLGTVLLITLVSGSRAETLQNFANDFWAWRAREQPFSTDDIPRLDRPADLAIDWSPQA